MSAVTEYIDLCSRRGCYEAGSDVLDAMRDARQTTKEKFLEQAFALCVDPSRTGREGKQKLKVEDRCQGDKCSVRSATCGLTTPKVANFHTHPYRQQPSFEPTSPSFADLLSTANDEFNGRGEGVQCIVSNLHDKVSCFKLKEHLTPEQLHRGIRAYQRGSSRKPGLEEWARVIGNETGFWEPAPAQTFALGEAETAPPQPIVTPPLEPPKPKEFGKKEYRERVGKYRYYGTLARETDAMRKGILNPYSKEAREASKDLRSEKRALNQRISETEGSVYGKMPENEKRRANDLKKTSADFRKVRRVALKEIIDSCRNSRSERCIT